MDGSGFREAGYVLLCERTSHYVLYKYYYLFLFFRKKGAGGWFCELPFVVSETEIPFGGYLAFYQSIKQFNPMNHVLPSDQANFQERVYFDSSLTCKSKYHATRVLW